MIKKIHIKKDYEVRLDKYLKNLFTSLTQSFIEKNIRKKNILINNSTTKANYLVKLNDNLKILNSILFLLKCLIASSPKYLEKP